MKRTVEKSLKNRSKWHVAFAEDDAWYDTLAYNSRKFECRWGMERLGGFFFFFLQFIFYWLDERGMKDTYVEYKYLSVMPDHVPKRTAS